MRFNCLKATEQLRGDSLLFTTLIWEGRKAGSTLEPPSGFEHGTTELGIQCINLEVIAP